MVPARTLIFWLLDGVLTGCTIATGFRPHCVVGKSDMVERHFSRLDLCFHPRGASDRGSIVHKLCASSVAKAG